MINLADLQSALTLLSSTKTNQSDQTPAVAQTAQVASRPALSGAASQPSTPAFYTMSISETFSVKDGQIAGTFQGTASGPGAPALTDTSDYKMFEDQLSENSLTPQQLTADAENNVTLGSVEDDESTFLDDVKMDYNQGTGGASEATQIEQALADGTLQVQNAADVQGLDFTSEGTTQIGDNGSEGGGDTSMNTAFLDANPDGKQHALVDFGYVAAYLTW